MNRFRLVLAFVFLGIAGLVLAAYAGLQVGVGPAAGEPQLYLWDVLRDDGLYLAAVFVLLGLGWAYFGKIYASAAPTPDAAQ